MLSQLSPQRLAELCNGQWYQGTIPSARFTAAQIDSRLMNNNQLFIALQGEQTDGHKFIDKLDPERQQAAIVEQPAPQARAAQLCVASSLHALRALSEEISNRTKATNLPSQVQSARQERKICCVQMLATFGPTPCNERTIITII